MPNSYFQFKQFRIDQESAAHKVGTDGVLIGAWASHTSPLNILDIGTGTGLIALMMAQRYQGSKVSAIDINKKSIEQAKTNVAASKFSNQIRCYHQDLLEINEEPKYDLIVSNPPFFKAGIEGNTAREVARHQKDNFIIQLFKKSWKMLKANGSLALILPVEQANELMDYHPFLFRKTIVKNKKSAEAKRVLLQWKKTEERLILQNSEFLIRNEDNSYHEDYKNLFQEFYL